MLWIEWHTATENSPPFVLVVPFILLCTLRGMSSSEDDMTRRSCRCRVCGRGLLGEGRVSWLPYDFKLRSLNGRRSLSAAKSACRWKAMVEESRDLQWYRVKYCKLKSRPPQMGFSKGMCMNNARKEEGRARWQNE